MVGTDKRSIPGEFSQRQLTFFSCYRLGLVIKTPWRKNETQQKIHKKTHRVFSFTSTSAAKASQEGRPPPAAGTESRARESCQTSPFSSQMVWSATFPFNGQARKPASWAVDHTKKTNKQKQSSFRPGGQWQVWLIRWPAGSCHHQVERNRQGLVVSWARDYHGVLGRECSSANKETGTMVFTLPGPHV